MKRLAVIFFALLALAAAPFASAATIEDAELNGNLLTDLSGPGSVQVDPGFLNRDPIVLSIRPDDDLLVFNSLVSILLADGARGLSVSLGGGATWNLVGSILPITAFSFSTTVSSTRVGILFNPAEFIEVDLGDVGFGGTNWIIDTTQVADLFTLTMQVVPEPATTLLLASAMLGFLTLRRRRSC